MQNRAPAFLDHDAACAQVAAQFSPRWLRHYSSAKLRRDPVFSAATDLLGETKLPLLDVGCGVGLLPFYLRARGFAPPITGLEIDARKLAHARSVSSENISFQERDLHEELPKFSGNIALFDVLHYLPVTRQETLLRELVARVAPGGMLLIRDCPRDGSAKFWTTCAAEIFAQAISWNLSTRLHFPTRELIQRTCPKAEERPMPATGPFNNHLFIFRRQPPAL